MADYRCYLTTAGIAAENNAKNFGTKLKITEMVFDGAYLADELNPENLTAVIQPELNVPCSTTLSDDEQTITFKGSILVEQGGFNVWGIGLKTEDGILYAYARSKGDKILTEDEGATESVRYAVDIITKNADVIEIKINQSTVYADLEDVDNRIKEHEAEPDPHPVYRLKSDANKSLYSTSLDLNVTATVGTIAYNSITNATIRYVECDDGFVISGDFSLEFDAFSLPTDDSFICTIYFPEEAKEFFGVTKLYTSCCGLAIAEPGAPTRDYTPTAMKAITGPSDNSVTFSTGELLGQSSNPTPSDANWIKITFTVTGAGKIK